MLKNRLFISSVLVAIILVVVHYVGSQLSWYWSYPIFDIIVHIIGGLWISLVCLALATYLGEINSLKEYRIKSFLITIIFAAVFGVAWELLEYFGQITMIQADGYFLDTTLDILADVFGGVLAYLFFIKRRRVSIIANDNLHPFYNKVSVAHN